MTHQGCTPQAALGSAPAPAGFSFSLPLKEFRLELELTDAARLPPWPGTEIRGMILQGLRATLCREDQAMACRSCPATGVCAYPALTGELPVRPALRALGVDRPPAPWLLHWPLESFPREERMRLWRPGERIVFHLLLLGPYIEALPHFIHGLAVIGRKPYLGWQVRGGFVTALAERVWREGGRERARVVFQDGAPAPGEPPPETLAGRLSQRLEQLADAQALRLEFQTPLRLMLHDKPVDQLTPGLLIERCLHRMKLLAAVWGEASPASFPEVTPAAEFVSADFRYRPWKRPGRGKQLIPYGGLLGEAVIGAAEPAVKALLAAAEVLHLGRGATLGLGQVGVNQL